MSENCLRTAAAPPHRRRRHRLEFFALEPHLNHVWAALVVVVKFLAVHAVDALIDVDMPLGMDRLHGAVLGAALARGSALFPAAKPFEGSDAAGNRQRSTERTQIAAEETFDEQADDEQPARIGDERPAAREFQDDGGLERLDLGERLG